MNRTFYSFVLILLFSCHPSIPEENELLIDKCVLKYEELDGSEYIGYVYVLCSNASNPVRNIDASAKVQKKDSLFMISLSIDNDSIYKDRIFYARINCDSLEQDERIFRIIPRDSLGSGLIHGNFDSKFAGIQFSYIDRNCVDKIAFTGYRR